MRIKTHRTPRSFTIGASWCRKPRVIMVVLPFVHIDIRPGEACKSCEGHGFHHYESGDSTGSDECETCNGTGIQP